MKTVMMIFAAIGVSLFDMMTVVVTFCWICGVLDLNNAQGVSLLGMWMVGGCITVAIGEVSTSL